MEILPYKSEHEKLIISAISEDKNWDMFTNGESLIRYKTTLANSVTYVCINGSEFCGYVRALLDDGFAVYISELFVVPKHRGKKVGRSLLEKVRNEFSSLTVYALSDEDAYYEKIGYKNVGSIFEL